MTIFHLAALGLPLLATFAVAKTDIEGCTSFTSTVTPWPGQRDTYETVLYYVPDTLEICQGVDCGGGRAPPRNVPGCPIYKGTETVKTMYLTVDPMAPVRTVETTTATATATATETKSTDSLSTAVAPPPSSSASSPPPTSASSASTISAPAVPSSNTSSAETPISSHISSTDGHSVSSHPSITETIHSTVSVSDSAAQPTAVFPAAMKVVAGVVAGVVLL